jgi:putative addiction module killer protein
MKYQLQSTKTFNNWLTGLKDAVSRNKVLSRLDRVSNGNFGDHKSIDANLYELRFSFGAGLRIYYTIRQSQVVLLVAGGDKSSQQRDIEKAKSIIKMLED